MSLSHFPIIELDSIDSTNNYAMHLIDADKAQHGLTITAQSQQAGKGQRGKTWLDAPGQSLLMSIIIIPRHTLQQQFLFSASVAVAIANVLQKLLTGCQLHIKWPNDIIVNDKKAGGILIENVLRGSRWTHSVVGLGLNIRQDSFPPDLPNATSLKIATGNDLDINEIRDSIRREIATTTLHPQPDELTMNSYNDYLYKRGRQQAFSSGDEQWEATIIAVHADGRLEVKLKNGTTAFYQHGQVLWQW